MCIICDSSRFRNLKAFAQLENMVDCIWHCYVNLVWIWLMYVILVNSTHTHTMNLHRKTFAHHTTLSYDAICSFFSTFVLKMHKCFSFHCTLCDSEKKPPILPSISCNCGENFILTLFDLCVRKCVWQERKCDKSVHAIASSQQILKHPLFILIKYTLSQCLFVYYFFLHTQLHLQFYVFLSGCYSILHRHCLIRLFSLVQNEEQKYRDTVSVFGNVFGLNLKLNVQKWAGDWDNGQ